MYTAIEQWLKEKLGIVLKDKLSVGCALQDGQIISMLLEYYGVTPQPCLKVDQSTCDGTSHYENLLALRKCFCMIGLDVKDSDLIGIAEGNNAVALKFLYGLYLNLENFTVCGKNKFQKKHPKFRITSRICVPFAYEKFPEQSDMRSYVSQQLRTICRKYRDRDVCVCKSKEQKFRCEPMKNVMQDIEQFEKMHTETFDKIEKPMRTLSIGTVEKEFEGIRLVDDENFLDHFVENLIQESQYEKQIGEALQHQKAILQDNLKLMNKIADEKAAACLEALREEHDNLMEENMLLREEEIEKQRKSEEAKINARVIEHGCYEITYNLICLAYRIASYGNVQIPDVVWYQWKQEFIKNQCDIEHDYTLENFDIPSEKTEEQGSEPCLDLNQNMKSLAKADLEDYLYFQRDWVSDEPKPLQDALGFVVTKLLILISPKPIPPNQPLIPDFISAHCLHGLPDKFHKFFKTFLESNQILFIIVEDLINFCISEYKESSGSMAGFSSTSENNGEVSIKSIDSGEMELNEDGEHERVANKETQTPAVLPEPNYAELCSAAMIGKSMATKVIQGEPINAQLIVQALICFLVRATGWRGWVLVDFPNAMTELCELESNLRGQFVPVKSKSNMVSEDLGDCRSKLVPFTVNLNKKTEPFVPYISHFIDIIADKETDMNGEKNAVCKFYKRYNRFKEFQYNPGPGLDKEDILSILRFILNDKESETMIEMSSFENMDFSGLSVFKESNKSKKYIFSYSKDTLTYEVEPEYEYEDERSDVQSEIFFKHYADFDAPVEMLSSLAKIWQKMESDYLTILEMNFFLKRKENSKMISFGLYVHKSFADVQNLPSKKQQAVDTFQREFNRLSKEQRNCANVKNELYDKVFMLQYQLWDMCDEAQMIRERVAHDLANADWFIDHLDVMCKVYLCIMNEELRRFTESMQIIADYYLLSLKKVPELQKPVDIEEKQIDVKVDNGDLDIRECVEFVSADGFLVTFQFLIDRINSTFEYYKEQINACNIINSKYSGMQEDLREQMESAVADETSRILLRTELIQRNFLSEVEEFELWYSSLLNDQFEICKTRFQNEISAVNSLCAIINMAIEEETPLCRRLMLHQDTFIIDSNLFLLPSQSCNALTLSSLLTLKSTSLTPTHIENLRQIFQNITPNGYILNKAFVFLLQDLLTEETHKNCLPEAWKTLTEQSMQAIAHEIFGNTLKYSWRDFLIQSYEIPYPNWHQLMNMAQVFRRYNHEQNDLIAWRDFSCSMLWFESDIPATHESTKLLKFKRFLFKLFQVDDERTNYMDLLFHLCKSDEPVFGFCKALCLVSKAPSMQALSDCPSFCEDSELQSPDPLISFESLQEVFTRFLSDPFPPDIQECVTFLATKWSSPRPMWEVQNLLASEPCLLAFLESMHKFKTCVVSNIVDRYI